MPNLISVSVDGLLGRFHHAFRFEPEWEFVILHGPNGVGKTRVLELIHAALRGEFASLVRTPFASAQLSFDDGSLLQLTRTGQLRLPGVNPEEPSDPPHVSVLLARPNRPEVGFTVGRNAGAKANRRATFLLERELGIERADATHWYDPDFGDRVTFDALVERYRPEYPEMFAEVEASVPEEVQGFLADLRVHLIETQRLLRRQPARGRSGRIRPDGHPMTVSRYSDDLVGRLNNALAENTTTSQRLDRTFPRRVLNAPEPDVTDEQIRQRYQEQGRLRDRLTGISLLDAAAADLPLPDRALAEWERRVLWTYLQDTEQKLATFQPLLERAQLLQEIVNSRFLFKNLQLDREQGFRFITDEGGEIGPSALSSGEQHELVLAYDLLFNVAPGSLVLIDEPEISLHVSWQRQFLNDLQKISSLQSLRFIIATHSPQVIHKWWERAVALYDDPEEHWAE